MGNFLAVLQAQLTPQVVFAMLGGLLGALTSSKRARDGYLLSGIFVTFGVACAMVASDFLTIRFTNHLLAAHFVIGMPVGGLGGAGMMAIRAISPSLANKIVGMADKAVDGLGESRVIEALAILFGRKKD